MFAAGTALLVAGCDDGPSLPGTGGQKGKGATQPPTPTVDPAVVAAVTTIAGHLNQLSARYAATIRRFPALTTKLAIATKNHATHLAKLKAIASPVTPSTAKVPVIPATQAAAITDLAGREQALAVAHATSAASLSGEPARLIGSIAAAESQLALWLGQLSAPPKKKAQR